MATTASQTFTTAKLSPLYPHEAVEIPVKLVASATYVKGQVLGELIGNNEVQTIALTTSGTLGGTYNVTFGAAATGSIAYNASAATLQSNLESLSTVGVGNVAVTGTTPTTGGGTLTLTFQNDLGYQNVAAVGVAVAGLTGSSSTATVATATAGSAGSPGTFGLYDVSASSGLQIAKGIIAHSCLTDSSNNITHGDVSTGGEFGQTYKQTPMYIAGTFDTDDLPNMTEAALSDLKGRLIKGTLGSGGEVRIG